MKLSKLKLLLPTAVLFASPWMHKLVYSNIILAWPSCDTGWAHFFAIGGAVISFFVTAMWAEQ